MFEKWSLIALGMIWILIPIWMAANIYLAWVKAKAVIKQAITLEAMAQILDRWDKANPEADRDAIEKLGLF